MSVANPCSRSQPQTFFITGGCGFIGSNFVRQQIAAGHRVVILDSLTYAGHLENLEGLSDSFELIVDTICNGSRVSELLHAYQINVLVNFAAESHVDRSIHAPSTFIDTNIQGFVNVLEACKFSNVKHLVFASSSSVYGANIKKPFSIKDMTDYPISLYGATKKANELLAHSYSSMYNIPCSGVRFFSVYGTYGRPDLALFIFTKNILDGIPITIYGDGESSRAYTYVDDVIDCVTKIINVIPNSKPPYEIYNIGSGNPIKLNKFIELIENNLNIKAIKNYVSMQIGDIQEAFSDDDNKMFESKIPVEEGVKLFVDWFKKYYKKE